MRLKYCNQCKLGKSLSLFKKDKRHVDGRSGTCKSCHVEQTIKWRKLHPEEYRKRLQIIAQKPSEKLRKKQFKQQNKALYCQYEMKRKAFLKFSTPKWLSIEQLEEMKEMYSLAKELSWLSEESLVVDHIMPILGRKSCGLHVPWNLQIISKKINEIKSNNEEGRVNL